MAASTSGAGLGGRPRSTPELRGLHAQRARAPRRATSSSDGARPRAGGAATAPPRSAPRTAAPRTSSTISAAISALITALPRSISTSTPSSGPRGLDRLQHELHVGADLARRIGHPAGRLDRHLVAAHLARQLDHAGGQRRAVRDDDEADHARRGRRRDAGARPGARCARRWPSRCASGRSRSRTPRARAGLLDLPEQPRPDVHRDLVLLALQAVRAGDAAAGRVVLDHPQLG